jgi:hypothetical protein
MKNELNELFLLIENELEEVPTTDLFDEFFDELDVEYINRDWETRYGFRPL